jgi:transcriptional regulator with XRE-family HTH domain
VITLSHGKEVSTMLNEILEKSGMSHERIAEEVFCSRSTIARAKAKETVLSPDIALRLAERFSCPEYTAYYCKSDCPIGQKYCYSLERKTIEQATLELLYWNGEVQKHTHTLKKIARDGKIEPDELGEANEAILCLMYLEKAVEEYKLAMADVLQITRLVKEVNEKTTCGRQTFGGS